MKQLRFATVLFVALLAGAGGLMPLPCEAASWPGFERGMGIGGKEDGLNFQGLIDGAAAKGGGMVVVPAGLARDFTFKGKKAEAVFRAFAKEQR